MKKTALIILLSFTALTINSTDAKSSHKFLIQDPEGNIFYYHNRNLQLQDGHLHMNGRGLTKTAFELAPDQNLEWLSNYGSVTFNYLGKEFPHGGMNEAGLTIQLIDHRSNESSTENSSSIKLNVFQWIQYQLDNFNCIEAIIKNATEVGYAEPEGTKFIFLVADAKGKTTLLSTKNGKVISKTFNGHKMRSGKNSLAKMARVKGIKSKTVSYYQSIHTMPQFTESPFLIFTPNDFSMRYIPSGVRHDIYLRVNKIEFSSAASNFYMSLARDGYSNPCKQYYSNYEINFLHNYKGAKEIYYLNDLSLDYLEAMAAYPGSMTSEIKRYNLSHFEK